MVSALLEGLGLPSYPMSVQLKAAEDEQASSLERYRSDLFELVEAGTASMVAAQVCLLGSYCATDFYRDFTVFYMRCD